MKIQVLDTTVDILHALTRATLEDLDILEAESEQLGEKLTVADMRAFIIQLVQATDAFEAASGGDNRRRLRALGWLVLRQGGDQRSLTELTGLALGDFAFVFEDETDGEGDDPKEPAAVDAAAVAEQTSRPSTPRERRSSSGSRSSAASTRASRSSTSGS